EGRQRAACAFILLVCSPRERVECGTRIGVVVPVIVEQRREYGRGTLRRSGTVEVRERLAVHGLLERREVGAPTTDFVTPCRPRGCRPCLLSRADAQQGAERRLPELASGDFGPAGRRSKPHRPISFRIVCGCQP